MGSCGNHPNISVMQLVIGGWGGGDAKSQQNTPEIYITCVILCLFSALSLRVDASQMSIIIINNNS